jgi:membrane fusion protein (multidrug efflux system)
MKKRMLIMLILAGVLFGGIFGYQAFKARMIRKSMAGHGEPPQTVSAIKASEQEWQLRVEAVGSLVAVRGADISPEVSGIVSRIHFTSGQEVDTGAPLLDLNADSDVAKLDSLKATAELARQIYARDRQQFEIRAISRATLDADIAGLRSADAQVAEQQALVDKKLIHAPFAGRLGIRAVDLGQYLDAGTKIVTLQSLDPIHVDFFLPQKSIGQIKVGQKVTVKTDAFPDRTFTGEIVAIDPKVDLNTRNAQVRATIQNPGHLLLPGMYATTAIAIGRPQRLITLPQTAITYNPYGNVVYLVEERGKGPDGKPLLVAQQKFVTTGETRGDQIAVLSGVKEGDTVVTSGQVKLRNGTPVIVNNTIVPADDPAPRPRDE